MPEHEKVYTICENMCLEESLTKEQINEQILKDSGVPKDGIIYFDGDEIPEGYEEVQIPTPSGEVANAITVGISSDFVISGTAEETIPISVVRTQKGNNLELKNNSIVIGDNIEFIKVSANVMINNYQTDDLRRISVKKNTSAMARTITYVSQKFTPLIITPYIIPVTKGDVITFTSNNNGASTTIYNAQRDTYFTVEAI